MKFSKTFVFLVFTILFTLAIDSSAQISRIEPDQPKWGQVLTISYDTAAPGAKFTPGDDVYAVGRLLSPGKSEQFSARMTLDGPRFKSRIDINNELSVANFHFITLNGGWDEQAYISTLIYRSDGKPARGAIESRINSKKYLDSFKQEIDLYPDNYAAYREKWSIALALEPERAEGMINSDLRRLIGVRNESPELLYAISYGHLLLGREEKSRETIGRLAARFSGAGFTGMAIDDYETETAGREFGNQGAAEIARIKLKIIDAYPDGEFARKSLTGLSNDQRAPLALIETVTERWMKAEPENPQGYFYLAQAYKNQYQKYDRAAPLIEKAIALLLDGKLRLYGDVNGKQSAEMTAASYLTKSDLAFRQNQYEKAISAVRTAESFEKEIGFAAHLLEARIWQAAGQEERSERAFIEAWRRGSTEAEERLKARYKDKRGSLQGFDEYLLSAGKLAKTGEAVENTKRPSPQFRVSSIDGHNFDLNAMQGKVVVLNLWFIACGPCRKEIPKLNQLVAEFKGKNVVFIAPSLDSAETLRGFLKKTPFAYNIVPDAEGIIIGKFNATNFPTHIVIDQDGQIETTLIGGSERRPEEVRRILLRLLNIQTSQ